MELSGKECFNLFVYLEENLLIWLLKFLSRLQNLKFLTIWEDQLRL